MREAPRAAHHHLLFFRLFLSFLLSLLKKTILSEQGEVLIYIELKASQSEVRHFSAITDAKPNHFMLLQLLILILFKSHMEFLNLFLLIKIGKLLFFLH